MGGAQRSTEHSARVDDEMAAETESLTRGAPIEAHAEEWAMTEPPADGEPGPESVIEFADDGVGGALDDNERRRRSELAAALPGHAFPGDRGKLVQAAEAEHAPDWVIEALADLPIDTRFDTPQAVWTALGGHRETRAAEPAPDAEVEVEAEPEVEARPEPATAQEPPSAPPALDLVARAAALVGIGVGIAGAVVGGTVNVARRVLGSLRR